MKRTDKQNRALHLWFRLLADEMNDHGLDMRKVLKPEIEIYWTPQMVKEYLWRPIQKIMLGKKSTTELETKEIDQVLDIITKHLGEKFGLTVPFPSIDELLLQMEEK